MPSRIRMTRMLSGQQDGAAVGTLAILMVARVNPGTLKSDGGQNSEST